MVKALSLFPILSMMSVFALSPLKAQDFRSYLTTEDNSRNQKTLIAVSASFTENELRIYHYDDLPIDEISDTAFQDTNFESLMMSNNVTHITNAVFTASKIKHMHYTGSSEEYNALILQREITYQFESISFYSYDEGFINYWNEKIRPTEDTNICGDVTSTTFQEMYGYYRALEDEDKEVVNDYKDKAGFKIKDSIKELETHFLGPSQTNKTEEWNQTGAITLIIFIAVIGMTSITIFFLLKTRNIIQ